MTPRVLLIVKKRMNTSYSAYYGRAVGLINSANFTANALVNAGIEAKAVEVIDNNGIDKEVHDFKPTHVVVEALWVVPSKFDVLLKLYPKVKWVVRLHSKAPFLANEGVAFNWINGYLEMAGKYGNLAISTNNADFNYDLQKVLQHKSEYLPNIYCPPSYDLGPVSPRVDGEIHIGCFGAVRPMKNHLQQAIAAINFANEMDLNLKFHINATRNEQSGDNALKNIRALFLNPVNCRHELVEHDWLSHEEFINLVVQMDMGMQVSYSESFNIVTADFANNGIPIVVSKDIEWMPDMTKCDPNSGRDIVATMKCVWESHKFKLELIDNIALSWYNFKALEVWKKYLHGHKHRHH